MPGPGRLVAQRAGERTLADQHQPYLAAATFEQTHRLDQIKDTLLLDKSADKQDHWFVCFEERRLRRIADLDPLMDHFQLLVRKAADEKSVADRFGDANKQRCLPLQGGKAALVDARHEPRPVVRL